MNPLQNEDQFSIHVLNGGNYKVILSKDLETLKKAVKEYVDQGYTLIGKIHKSYCKNYFQQEMNLFQERNDERG